MRREHEQLLDDWRRDSKHAYRHTKLTTSQFRLQQSEPKLQGTPTCPQVTVGLGDDAVGIGGCELPMRRSGPPHPIADMMTIRVARDRANITRFHMSRP